MPLAYDPSKSSISAIEYISGSADDAPFQCGNNQSYSNSHDNPNNGTDAQRTADCLKLSPKGSTVAA